jgi:chromosome segregation ATPase
MGIDRGAIEILKADLANAKQVFERSKNDLTVIDAQIRELHERRKPWERVFQFQRKRVTKLETVIGMLECTDTPLEENEKTPSTAKGPDMKDLLVRIATNVNSEMLESLLLAVPDAYLDNKALTLRLSASGFDSIRERITANRERIEKAAEKVLGYGPIRVFVNKKEEVFE